MIPIELYTAGGISKTIEFPENWNELTPEQVKIVVSVLDADYSTLIEQKAAMLMQMISHLSGYEMAQKAIDIEEFVIAGIPLIEFLFKDNTLSINPVPTIIIGSKTFYGPKNHFDGLITAEYEDAFIPFVNYKTSQDIKYLAQLMAILWRQKGIKYISFSSKTNENLIYDWKAAVPIFEKLSTEILFSVFIWFDGCQNLLQKIFHEVYEGGSTTSEPDLMAFTKCIHAAAGAKNGTRDQVRRLELKELLFDMNQEAIKANELKEYYANGKS